MLNREKFAKEIIELAINDSDALAISNGVPTSCASLLDCEGCDFHEEDCDFAIKEWLEQEYTGPAVDWSRVAVDTPILVRDSSSEAWVRRYFARFSEDNKICTFPAGATSWSNNVKGWKEKPWKVEPWLQGKLADNEEDQ